MATLLLAFAAEAQGAVNNEARESAIEEEIVVTGTYIKSAPEDSPLPTTTLRRDNLILEEMQGGTFTVSNGGVFGSLLSTPILNPPQTGILGLHKIEERPVVVDGEVVARPMMYLALSYDHRLIDGREAVRFLVTIKELIEDPARILLEL